MSNREWHEDQAAGERALHKLERQLQLDSRLGDALRSSGIDSVEAKQALFALARHSGSHRLVVAMRAIEAWLAEGGAR